MARSLELYDIDNPGYIITVTYKVTTAFTEKNVTYEKNDIIDAETYRNLSAINKKKCNEYEKKAKITSNSNGGIFNVGVKVDGEIDNNSFTLSSYNNNWAKYSSKRDGDGRVFVKVIIPKNLIPQEREATINVLHKSSSKCSDTITVQQEGIKYLLKNESNCHYHAFKSMPPLANMFEEKRIKLNAYNGRGLWRVKQVRQYQALGSDSFNDKAYNGENIDEFENRNGVMQTYTTYDNAFNYYIKNNELVVRSYGQIDLTKNIQSDGSPHMRYFFVVTHCDVDNENKTYLDEILDKNEQYEDNILFVFDGDSGDSYREDYSSIDSDSTTPKKGENYVFTVNGGYYISDDDCDIRTLTVPAEGQEGLGVDVISTLNGDFHPYNGRIINPVDEQFVGIIRGIFVCEPNYIYDKETQTKKQNYDTRTNLIYFTQEDSKKQARLIIMQEGFNQTYAFAVKITSTDGEEITNTYDTDFSLNFNMAENSFIMEIVSTYGGNATNYTIGNVSDTWLKIEKKNGTDNIYNVTIDKNAGTATRASSVELKQTNSGKYLYMNIEQSSTSDANKFEAYFKTDSGTVNVLSVDYNYHEISTIVTSTHNGIIVDYNTEITYYDYESGEWKEATDESYSWLKYDQNYKLVYANERNDEEIRYKDDEYGFTTTAKITFTRDDLAYKVIEEFTVGDGETQKTYYVGEIISVDVYNNFPNTYKKKCERNEINLILKQIMKYDEAQTYCEPKYITVGYEGTYYSEPHTNIYSYAIINGSTTIPVQVTQWAQETGEFVKNTKFSDVILDESGKYYYKATVEVEENQESTRREAYILVKNLIGQTDGFYVTQKYYNEPDIYLYFSSEKITVGKLGRDDVTDDSWRLYSYKITNGVIEPVTGLKAAYAGDFIEFLIDPYFKDDYIKTDDNGYYYYELHMIVEYNPDAQARSEVFEFYNDYGNTAAITIEQEKGNNFWFDTHPYHVTVGYKGTEYHGDWWVFSYDKQHKENLVPLSVVSKPDFIATVDIPTEAYDTKYGARGRISFRTERNTSTVERTDEILLKNTIGDTCSLIVTQEGWPYDGDVKFYFAVDKLEVGYENGDYTDETWKIYSYQVKDGVKSLVPFTAQTLADNIFTKSCSMSKAMQDDTGYYYQITISVYNTKESSDIRTTTLSVINEIGTKISITVEQPVDETTIDIPYDYIVIQYTWQNLVEVEHPDLGSSYYRLGFDSIMYFEQTETGDMYHKCLSVGDATLSAENETGIETVYAGVYYNSDSQQIDTIFHTTTTIPINDRIQTQVIYLSRLKDDGYLKKIKKNGGALSMYLYGNYSCVPTALNYVSLKDRPVTVSIRAYLGGEMIQDTTKPKESIQNVGGTEIDTGISDETYTMSSTTYVLDNKYTFDNLDENSQCFGILSYNIKKKTLNFSPVIHN